MADRRAPARPRAIVTATFVIAAAILGGCANIPKGVEAVRDFDVERYQGTWYEIARFDSWFERGLADVTATYALREDGRVGLVNRGWDVERATTHLIHEVLEPGQGGLIAMAASGEIAMDYNTSAMFRGAADSEGRFEIAIWKD